jgi:hypothetical protein
MKVGNSLRCLRIVPHSFTDCDLSLGKLIEQTKTGYVTTSLKFRVRLRGAVDSEAFSSSLEIELI